MDMTRWPPGSAALPPLFAGPGAQPISFMIKPPPALAQQIGGCRGSWGIDQRYGPERLHTTLQPLCDGRDISADLIALLGEAVLSLHAEPFAIGFARVRGNALSGGGNPRVHDFRRRLLNRLGAFGILAPPYRLRPHLSLVYGERTSRNFAVEQIGWTVERVLLVRSVHGQGRHEHLGEYRLSPPQGVFDF